MDFRRLDGCSRRGVLIFRPARPSASMLSRLGDSVFPHLDSRYSDRRTAAGPDESTDGPSRPPGPARSGRRPQPARRRGPFPPNRTGPLHPTRRARLAGRPLDAPGAGGMPPRSSRRSAAGWPSGPSMTSWWPRPSRMRGRVEGRGGDARADRRAGSGRGAFAGPVGRTTRPGQGDAAEVLASLTRQTQRE